MILNDFSYTYDMSTDDVVVEREKLIREMTNPPKWAEDDVKGLYLFGSRSMAIRDNYVDANGCKFDNKKISSRILPSTDYDYSMSIEDTNKIVNLLQNGYTFSPVSNYYNHCYLFRGVFKKSVGDESVEIIARSDEYLFEKAWESINPEFWYKYMWKSSPEFEFLQYSKAVQKLKICDMINEHYDTITNSKSFRKEIEMFSDGKVIRIDGGVNGIYYVDTYQDYVHVTSRLTALNCSWKEEYTVL